MKSMFGLFVKTNVMTRGTRTASLFVEDFIYEVQNHNIVSQIFGVDMFSKSILYCNRGNE